MLSKHIGMNVFRTQADMLGKTGTEPGGVQHGAGAKDLTLRQIGVFPVSYTHLDVYKRQELQRRPQNVCFKQGHGVR